MRPYPLARPFTSTRQRQFPPAHRAMPCDLRTQLWGHLAPEASQVRRDSSLGDHL